MAYQGANGIDPESILAKNRDFPVPDLAIILEIDPPAGIQRIEKQRREEPNTFEKEANLQEVAKIFAAMPQEYIERINGSGTIEEIHGLVLETVTRVLARKIRQATAVAG